MASEDKPMVAGRGPILLWACMTLASGVIIVSAGSLEGYLVFATVALAICAAVLYYRFRAFRRKAPALLSTGQALEPYDYSTQARKGVYLISGVLVAFLLPFLLSGILDTASWLGSIIGAIDGWLLSLLVYNVSLGSWQRSHGGKLFQTEVWRGTKVTHKGLKFMKVSH